MKKYFFFLLLPIFFGGCQKDFNDVVDSDITSFQVEYVNVSPLSSNSKFIFSVLDSNITIRLKINSSKDVKDIFCNLISSDNRQLNESNIHLLDNGLTSNGDTVKGDNIFSNKFPLSSSYPIGLYSVKFFIADKNDETKEAAIQSFEYDNGQGNIAPVISNLVMPDTIKKNVQFLFTISVLDSNGLNDVLDVFYKTYKPDGTIVTNSQGLTQFPMFDDGETQNNGDQVAGDGIYTVGLSFPANQPSGTWRFELQAADRKGKLSNIISHNIVVQ